MAIAPIVDIDALIRDLRIGVGYASKAGLLRDRNVLDVVKAADLALRKDDHAALDTGALTTALNEVAQTISPITIADLLFGRDPFSPENQQRSKLLQLGLSIFAFLLLLMVGYFMHSLQSEQAAIQAVQQVQDLQPQLKLTALRNMAQYEKPVGRQSALYDAFHQKVFELRQVNSRVFTAYNDALHASTIPLFPLGNLFSTPLSTAPPMIGSDFSAALSATKDPGTKRDAVAAEAMPEGRVVKDSSGSGALVPAAAVSDARQADGDGASVQATAQVDQFCLEDSTGEIRLPPESAHFPEWMKAVLKDALGDFCFQLNVLSPGGDGALLNQTMTNLSVLTLIKQKVDLRVSWFLPFLFGLLGSTVYMMRNVASVRTPSMELFPMIMRLSLGGVAGIVIGWFAAAATGTTEITKTLSLPFALAFLVGYGIDSLFGLLDRLNRMISDPPKTA